MLGARGFAGRRIATDWPVIVDEALAARSLPEKLVRPPGGRGPGTLHVRVASGPVAVEMQHREPLIVERINAYFGFRAVARLRLMQAPLPPPAPRPPAPLSPDPQASAAIEATVASVENPRLRQVLADLGQCLLARSEPRER
jgi:hypothetical protein